MVILVKIRMLLLFGVDIVFCFIYCNFIDVIVLDFGSFGVFDFEKLDVFVVMFIERWIVFVFFFLWY